MQYSEYKESYVSWPIQEKQALYAPDEYACPITLSEEPSTKNWKTVNHVDFTDFEDDAVLALDSEQIAGCPPVEDVGKFAPAFFAWSVSADEAAEGVDVSGKDQEASPKYNSGSPQSRSIAPSSPTKDGMAENISESQENYIWQKVCAQKAENPTRIFDPNFLSENSELDPSTWKTESQAKNQEMSNASALALKNCEKPFVCGVKQSSEEVHPGCFAWSRLDPAHEQDENFQQVSQINPATSSNHNIIASAEERKSSAPIKSEYSSKFVLPSKMVMTKYTVQAESRLQMGLNINDMDASKWKSEYDASCDGWKTSLQKQPEPSSALRKRRSLKKSTIAKQSLRALVPDEFPEDEEIDGFVIVENSSSIKENKNLVKRNSKNDKENEPIEPNNVFPPSTSSLVDQFVSEHERRYVWPEMKKSTTDSSTKIMCTESSKIEMSALSPPYALDDDIVDLPRNKTKQYPLSVAQPLNLFDANPRIKSGGGTSATIITPPYACGDMRFLAIPSDPKIGQKTVFSARTFRAPEAPDSEYGYAYVWGDARDEVIKHNPNGESNRKKNVYTTSEKNLQYTLGGAECDWEKLTKENPVLVYSDIEEEKINLKTIKTVVNTPSYVKKSPYVRSTESIGSSKSRSMPLKITKRQASSGTRKVDSSILSANADAMLRRALKQAERAVQPDDFGGFKDVNNIYEGIYSVDEASSDISDASPMKMTRPFKPSSHVNASKRVLTRKDSTHNGNKNTSNPLLRNKRYPNLSDAQSGRWKSETKRSYTKYVKK